MKITDFNVGDNIQLKNGELFCIMDIQHNGKILKIANPHHQLDIHWRMAADHWPLMYADDFEADSRGVGI